MASGALGVVGAAARGVQAIGPARDRQKWWQRRRARRQSERRTTPVAYLRQDRAKTLGVVGAMARTPVERSLRCRLQTRGTEIARRLQASRDRRQVSLFKTGAARDRPRRGARRLVARGCRAR